MVNNKIFIVCKYLKTGGPRSLHQLGNILKSKGKDVYIYYFNNPNATNPIYEDCNCKVVNRVEDSCNNIVIIPETCFHLLDEFTKCKICIWWLSLYFYRKEDANWQILQLLDLNGLPHILYPIAYLSKRVRNLINRKELHDIYSYEKRYYQYLHFYNCEYAREYIKSIGISDHQMHYLCGPLEKYFYKMDYNVILRKKRNLILINPSKSSRYLLYALKKGIKRVCKDVEIVELKNLTPEQIKTLFVQAKLYIDLGLFPGPERMPREAVAAYCNIITSKNGAAKNDIDVPIPEQYKFKTNIIDVSKTVRLASDMIMDYENYLSDFDSYRMKVYKQIDGFENDIDEIIQLIDTL